MLTSANPSSQKPAAAPACKWLRKFIRHARGSITIAAALAMTIALICIGGAVDFANVNRATSLLLSSADAASLAAVSMGSQGYAAATTMSANGRVKSAEDAANAMFNATIAGKNGFTLKSVKTVALKANTTLTAATTFNATVPTTFLSLLGMKSIAISQTSTATSPLPVYIDFHLLLDNSPSMGVAASQSDIDVMVANTPDKCAFACHDQSTPNNYYNLAHSLGVTMRIDVLRKATQNLMTTADDVATVPNQYRVSIDTFNMDVKSIWSLSSDLSGAKSAASAIDLMPVPYQNWNNDRDTDLSMIWPKMNSEIDNPGSGAAPSTAQKVLFMVTDGVSDRAAGSNRIIEPLDPSQCTGLKDRGVKIAVLHTSYLPLPTNAFYNAYVAPWADQIPSKMEACASPGLYFQVSPTQGISEAMNALFLRIVGQARISS